MSTIRVMILGAILLIAPFAFAEDDAAPVTRFVNATIEQTEETIVLALESDCPGLQATASQNIRDLKNMFPERSFSSHVIPLMGIVKSEKAPSYARILAALALHELHSGRGDYAIFRTAEFTDSPRIRHLCQWLAYKQALEDRADTAQNSNGGGIDMSWMMLE